MIRTNALSKHEWAGWGLLLAIGICSHFVGLGDRVLSYDESVHAFYSYRLAETGSYIHSPVTHGPLLFYLSALVFLLSPATDFTVRLIPAIAGSGLVVMPLLFRRWIGAGAAFAAGLLITASPLLLYFGRYLRNDIYILVLLLAWVFAIFRFLETPRLSLLYSLTIAMALSFACKEVSFISASLIFPFLLIMAALNRQHDPLPSLQLSILHFTLLLPLSMPLVLRLTGLEATRVWLENHPRWGLGSSILGILVSVVIAFLATSRIARAGGVLTFRNWLKAAALFWLILGFYFSTFLKNPPGLFTGLFQGLNYWLSQHHVERGGQPVYYYLILLGLYEFIVVLLSIGSLGSLAVKVMQRGARNWLSGLTEKPGERFNVFCVWWGIGSLLAYSVAGERMPWLAVHILLPFIFLSAGMISSRLNRIRSAGHLPRNPLLILGLILTGVIAVLGLRTSVQLNFVNGGLPVEPVAYAQGGPAAPELAAKIRGFAHKGTQVAIDNRVAWPLSWYLREIAPNCRTGDFAAGVPLEFGLLVSASPGPGNGLESNDWRLLSQGPVLWWPIHDYRRLYASQTGAGSLREGLVTFWEVFYNRHFQGLAIESWPARQDAWLYDRTATHRRHRLAPSD